MKDILTRTALDVRKMGAPHVGSVLKTPAYMGSSGMGLWVDFIPTISITVPGVEIHVLDPSSYEIFYSKYARWGSMFFAAGGLRIDNFEGVDGQLNIVLPSSTVPTSGATGIGFGTYYQGSFSNNNSLAGEFTDDIISLYAWDGTFITSKFTPGPMGYIGFRLDW